MVPLFVSIVACFTGSFSAELSRFTRWADVVQDACGAPRAARHAHAASVKYQQMRERCPILAWKLPHEILLDLHRIILFRESQPPADTPHMCIDDDAFRRVECDAEDHVGGLAPDAGEGDQLVERARDAA